jgi:hypothetical protein
MDIDRLQEIERWLSEQAEATSSTNKTLAKLFLLLSNKEVKDITLPPLVPAPIPPPPVTTILSTSQPLQIRPGAPNNFNRDQLKLS